MDLWDVVSVQSLISGPTVTEASPSEKPFLFGGLISSKLALGSWDSILEK